MNNEFINKRIENTSYDIYPLDRMLPIETVYSMFAQKYAQSDDRNLFFRDRKFQRLREGYSAIFIAISLQDYFKKPHFLMFPSDPSNDVTILYQFEEGKDKFGAYLFDIKEYTSYSDSFKSFIEKSIASKIDIYNMAIVTYRTIDAQDIKYLMDFLKNRPETSKIWLLSSPTEQEQDNKLSRVTVMKGDSILYNEIINLDDWIDLNKPTVVYQDIVKFYTE